MSKHIKSFLHYNVDDGIIYEPIESLTTNTVNTTDLNSVRVTSDSVTLTSTGFDKNFVNFGRDAVVLTANLEALLNGLTYRGGSLPFDESTGAFTSTNQGLYVISMMSNITTAAGRTELGFRVQDINTLTTLYRNLAVTGDAYPDTEGILVHNAILYLNAGQSVQFLVMCSGSETVDFDIKIIRIYGFDL